MTQCPPGPPPPEELAGTALLVPPAPGGTVLVVRASAEPPKLTAVRECDAVTALKRGLKEYLEQVYVDVDGVRVRFEQVHHVWAETDQVATYPSAVVLAAEEAAYDYSSFTPMLDPTRLVINGAEPSDRRSYLVKYAEVTLRLAIEVHCSSPAERSSIMMLLEDALNPVDWMYGFQLDLPHYFNQRAVYEPTTGQMMDSDADARRRWRPGTVFLTGQISLMRVRSLPNFQPKLVVEVITAEEGYVADVQEASPVPEPQPVSSWSDGWSDGFGG